MWSFALTPPSIASKSISNNMSRASFNIKLVIKLLGFMLFLESGALLLSGLVAWWYKGDDTLWFMISAGITAASGLIFYFIGRQAKRTNIGKQEAYAFVTLVWLLFSFFGLLPYYLGGYINTITNAFFETMSGFTTTGSSVMLNVEIMPHGILFWRSLTQWMGGMGIILLSLAVMPLLNMGNVGLFAAEVPGPKVDKLQPRISGTARILWAIYLILTAAEIVLLKFAGMGFFDAICHALTSMATGGFSTKNNSVAAFDSPAIEYIIIAFMFMAGTSFSLIYWAFTLNFKKLKHNDEFSWYVYVVVIVTVFLAFGLWHVESLPINDAFRTALFQTVSFLTTTGFTTTTGYMHWEPLLWSVFLVIMLLGGMSGSTAGGIKISRIIILVRQSKCELKRQVHPNAVIPVRYNGKNLPDTIVASVFGFLVLYILLVFLGTAILLSEGLYLDDALGAVISSISNVGPGFGAFTQNYFIMPDLSTWTLSFLMLAGRLELFTVILLLTPWFWRR